MPLHRVLGASVVGLALAGLLLSAPVRAAEVEKLLPNDSEIILTINVKQMLHSPLVQKLPLDKLKQVLKSQDEVQKVLTELNFDPFSDIESLTIADSSGTET